MTAAEPRRQRKKLKALNADLTDAERREVRSQQRTIGEKMANGEMSWEDGRDQNNALFSKKVAFTRELALDLENSKIALSGFAKEVEATVQVRRRMTTAWLHLTQHDIGSTL